MKRQLILMLRWLKWHTAAPLARLLGYFRNPKQIISVWPEAGITLGPRVVLFMHFDGAGNVRPQIFDYLNDLAANNLEVVFVTNAAKLNAPALQNLQEICAGIIIRRNIGYDFGAWRDAILHLDLPQAQTEEVILANDSVFGPLTPMGDVLRRINYKKADVWGLTESWQVRYHLQSFFMAFGPAALQAEAWRKFWRQVRPVPMKAYVVRTYEIGITQAMVKGGLSCTAMWPYETLLKKVDNVSFGQLVEESETNVGKLDPIVRNRKLQALRLRDAIARRIAPTAVLTRRSTCMARSAR